jgi:Fur family zinc uptake transcriptional regulator
MEFSSAETALFARGNLRRILLQCNMHLGWECDKLKPGAKPLIAKPQPVFPAPGHDHDRCTHDAVAHAEAICAARKERLTPIRRRVLEALLESHAPLGAYELIDRLAEDGARPAPITIYRALDFLREQGLVHRIESRNAFIACVHNHTSGDPVVFLICEKCGAVGEAAGAAVAQTIRTASRAAGFTPKTPVVEISGICAHCKTA